MTATQLLLTWSRSLQLPSLLISRLDCAHGAVAMHNLQFPRYYAHSCACILSDFSPVWRGAFFPSSFRANSLFLDQGMRYKVMLMYSNWYEQVSLGSTPLTAAAVAGRV